MWGRSLIMPLILYGSLVYWTPSCKLLISPTLTMICPSVLMVFSQCTEHPFVYSGYPPSVLMIFSWYTQHTSPPRMYLRYPRMYLTSFSVLHRHYAGWLWSFWVFLIKYISCSRKTYTITVNWKSVRHSENKYVTWLNLLWNEVQAAVPLIFIVFRQHKLHNIFIFGMAYCDDLELIMKIRYSTH